MAVISGTNLPHRHSLNILRRARIIYLLPGLLFFQPADVSAMHRNSFQPVTFSSATWSAPPQQTAESLKEKLRQSPILPSLENTALRLKAAKIQGEPLPFYERISIYGTVASAISGDNSTGGYDLLLTYISTGFNNSSSDPKKAHHAFLTALLICQELEKHAGENTVVNPPQVKWLYWQLLLLLNHRSVQDFFWLASKAASLYIDDQSNMELRRLRALHYLLTGNNSAIDDYRILAGLSDWKGKITSEPLKEYFHLFMIRAALGKARALIVAEDPQENIKKLLGDIGMRLTTVKRLPGLQSDNAQKAITDAEQVHQEYLAKIYVTPDMGTQPSGLHPFKYPVLMSAIPEVWKPNP